VTKENGTLNKDLSTFMIITPQLFLEWEVF